MASVEQILFGPVGKQYCFVFYALEIWFFIILALNILFYLYKSFTQKLPAAVHFASVSALIMGFGIYFVWRIMYSICSGAL
jgi:hypothetical protein